MALPSDSDYQTALQNPRQAFSDPELREGEPELGTGAMAGLPRPRAGNFATAYKLHCGEKAWAVRCFTRRVAPDQQERYTEIGRHLKARRLPYSVGFTFLPRGIQVSGQWHPIVKMEWVQGESLGSYVEKHRSAPKALLALATQWVEMLTALQHAGVAHGDLQHGNVMVVPGGLRLIDYDGMFVPALAGRGSHERGHDNYQHPLRDSGFFDPRLDHFSAWVVLLSLVALAHEPALWDQFEGGDDCLLFRKRDFVDPEGSKLLRAMRGSRHERVKFIATFFDSLLRLPLAQVPALSGHALSAVDAPEMHIRARSHWVQEFLAPEESASASFTSPSLFERQAGGGALLAALGVGALALSVSPLWGGGLGVIGLSTLAWVRSMYARQPSTQRRARLQVRLAEAKAELERADALLQSLTEERARIAGNVQALSGELAPLREQREKALEALRQKYQPELDWLTYHQKHLDQQEETARRALESEARSREDDVARQLSLLEDTKAHFARMRQDSRAQGAEVRKALQWEEANVEGKTAPELQRITAELEPNQRSLDALDERIAAVGQDLVTLRWNHEQAANRLAPYEPLRFGRYLSYLLNHDHEPT